MDEIQSGQTANRRPWGKLRRNLDGTTAFHPLIAHLADVAAVFEALLQVEVIRSRLEICAGHPLDAAMYSRLAALAALHDIGKYATAFQNKAYPGNKNTIGHIKALTGLFYKDSLDKLWVVFPFLKDWSVQAPEAFCAIFTGLCSHHGSPAQPLASPTDMRQYIFESAWNTTEEYDPFQAMRPLADALTIWFPEAFRDDRPLPESPIFSHYFSGLLILADWLGSDDQLFPYCGEAGRPKDGDPMPFARARAKEVLARAGLAPVRLDCPSAPDFATIFSFQPNTMQTAMSKLPLDKGGSLVILEAETGNGKTEAALFHFLRLFQAGLVDGLYFANPLRLAAKQLHGRVGDFARQAFPGWRPPVVLAIPGYLRTDEAEGYRLADYQVLWSDSPDPTRNWACEQPKRFLSAPLAVGTIDQAMLAGMRLDHSHLRAVALSRSLLVVDEVHASDAYMARLVRNLIAWTRRTGGHVLLMSATLGGADRGEYLHEAQGIGSRLRRRPDSRACLSKPYPLITSCSWQGAEVRDIAPQPEADLKSKEVQVTLRPDMAKPEAVARLAARYARAGACVLVLRNTVARAVETALALEAELGADSPLLFRVCDVPTTHHGRFAREDRLLLDDAVTQHFGKACSATGLRQPGVLVATQTLEQSLDVDFDLIITDLCPVDVLLQRIGRLHRHKNTRPEGCARPTCIVLRPEDEPESWLLSQAAKSYGFGPDRAYAHVVSVLATARLLLETPVLRIPDMNRKLVETATHPDCLGRLAAGLGQAWTTRLREIQGGGIAQNAQAAVITIEWNKPYGPDSAAGSPDEAIRTRLGLDDRMAEFPDGTPGPFGQMIRAVRIPSWLVRGAPSEVEPEILAAADGQLTFRYGPSVLLYDRFGLRKPSTQTGGL